MEALFAGEADLGGAMLSSTGTEEPAEIPSVPEAPEAKDDE